MTDGVLIFVGLVIQTTGILISIWFVLIELRRSRKNIFYTNIMTLEQEISENTKDIWGIPPDNRLLVEGKQIEIDLEKLRYMVRLLDTYDLGRTQKIFYDKKPFPEESIVYRMFQNELYRDYWKYIVKSRFYAGGGDRFCEVIDKTVSLIESRLVKNSP